MRSKVLVCLCALVLVSVSGAFAAAPELTAAPTVEQPMPAEDFVEALAGADLSKPINNVVISCSVTCTTNLQCFSKCGPGFCGGSCRVISTCGTRKVCDCLYCP